jgi:hypothetical protein
MSSRVAFGWEGYHLHRFRDERGREWGDTGFSDGGGFGAPSFADEEEAELGKSIPARRTRGAPAAVVPSPRRKTSGGSGGWKRSST